MTLGHKTRLAAALLAVVLAGGSHTSAQNTNDPPPPPSGRGGRFGGPGGPGGPAGLMLGSVNLTDAQKDQVRSIMQAHQPEMQTLGDKARAARGALQAAIAADAVDENAIRARSADVAAVDADMAVAQARLRGEIFQIL